MVIHMSTHRHSVLFSISTYCVYVSMRRHMYDHLKIVNRSLLTSLFPIYTSLLWYSVSLWSDCECTTTNKASMKIYIPVFYVYRSFVTSLFPIYTSLLWYLAPLWSDCECTTTNKVSMYISYIYRSFVTSLFPIYTSLLWYFPCLLRDCACATTKEARYVWPSEDCEYVSFNVSFSYLYISFVMSFVSLTWLCMRHNKESKCWYFSYFHIYINFFFAL